METTAAPRTNPRPVPDREDRLERTPPDGHPEWGP